MRDLLAGMVGNMDAWWVINCLQTRGMCSVRFCCAPSLLEMKQWGCSQKSRRSLKSSLVFSSLVSLSTCVEFILPAVSYSMCQKLLNQHRKAGFQIHSYDKEFILKYWYVKCRIWTFSWRLCIYYYYTAFFFFPTFKPQDLQTQTYVRWD